MEHRVPWPVQQIELSLVRSFPPPEKAFAVALIEVQGKREDDVGHLVDRKHRVLGRQGADSAGIIRVQSHCSAWVNLHLS